MRIFVLTGLALAGLLTGVNGVVPGQPESKKNGDQSAVVQGNNVFACELYARLRDKPGNLFFSPYSISSALAMTYAGARHDTAEQMARTLHFALEPDRLHHGFANLNAEINGQAGKRHYQLSVANALWGQKDQGFLPEFLRLTRTHYGAGLTELDFQKEAENARKTINAWVEHETRDKIKDLLPPGSVQASTRLVLTNAIYFKAGWQEKFPEKATRPEDFKVSAAKKVSVPMMHQNDTFVYFDGDTFQALQLPYEGGDLSMVVLLPRGEAGMAHLEQSLTLARLEGWLAKLRPHQVEVSMPRFKMTSEFNLKKELSALGMPLAFTDRADFSGMSTRNKLAIDEVVHKAYVDVNEKGTEAAAATGITMRTTSAQVLPRVTFRADHPFVFLIRDTRSGSILFLGRVTNPEG